MRGLFTYLTLGRAVYRLLRERFPEVDDVPLDDVLVVVTELLTTPATLDEAMVCAEVVPGTWPPRAPGRPTTGWWCGCPRRRARRDAPADRGVALLGNRRLRSWPAEGRLRDHVAGRD